jgi:hypothetical protein
MTRSISHFGSAAVFLAMAVASPLLAAPDTHHLSPAQASVIAGAIAKLKYPQERSLASHWSDAKKVAEFICRPMATAVIERRSNADRVFLGTDDPSTLHLVSDRQLEGSGQYRAGGDWHSFTFACALNPQNGTAISFKANVAPGK